MVLLTVFALSLLVLALQLATLFVLSVHSAEVNLPELDKWYEPRNSNKNFKAFFITKYSIKLKKEIVFKYLNSEDSLKGLSKEYKISFEIIKRWIDLAKTQGLATLKVKHVKQAYFPKIKLKLIRYYLTNDIDTSLTGARSNFNASQISVWTKHFKNQSLISSLNKQKGRNSEPCAKKLAAGIHAVQQAKSTNNHGYPP